MWLELVSGRLVEYEGDRRAGAATFSGYKVGDIDRGDIQNNKEEEEERQR